MVPPYFFEVTALLNTIWYPTESYFGLLPLFLGSVVVTVGALLSIPAATYTVKLMPPHAANSPAAVERFLREATAIAARSSARRGSRTTRRAASSSGPSRVDQVPLVSRITSRSRQLFSVSHSGSWVRMWLASFATATGTIHSSDSSRPSVSLVP